MSNASKIRIIICLSFIFFGIADNVEARRLVAILSHEPCNNHVYSDGTHVPHPIRRSSPPPPPPPDQCSNIRGYQYPVPSGYEKRSGACYLKKDELYLSCSAVNNPVRLDDEIVFQANVVYASGDVVFDWYNGNTTSGTSLKRQRAANTSFYRTTSGNTAGARTFTVRAIDGGGTSKSAQCGVTVSNDANILSGAGNDAIGPISIDFDVDNTLTNTTCLAEWTTENASECFLVNANENTNIEAVDLQGQKQVPAGVWSLQCVSSTLNGSSAQILTSDPEICKTNIDIREI